MAAKKAGSGLPAKTSAQVEVPGTDTQIDLSSLSAQIVAELAAGLADAGTVRAQYGISEAQWEVLKRNPVFRKMLAEAIVTWRGELNAGQRITKKAEIVLEDAIPVLDTIAHSPDTPAVARIEAIKQMASLAGRNAKEGASAGGGGGFMLNINIGAGKEKLVIEGKTVEAVSE